MKRVVLWSVVSLVTLLALSGGSIYLNTSLRGEPLQAALQHAAAGRDPDRALVAQTLLTNYLEQRRIAAVWSGVYWGFVWLAALLSALAALLLKIESIITSGEARRDVAAIASVAAALLITISTSGDFQRKWQATRTAAAEI